VLARLEEGGVEAAEVDRRGELLRVRLLSGSQVSEVVDALQRLGFAGEVLANEPPEVAWYGRDSIGELSREEGHVIARRVVPPFAKSYAVDVSEHDALTEAVAEALHRCFVRNTLDANPAGGLHDSCTRAVEDATRERLGARRAAALGRAIEADLNQRQAL
jgi:hypothetical protein